MKGGINVGENEGISMNYDDMEQELQRLEDYVIDFQETITKMTNSVNLLCDNWVASATESYREDYMATTKNMGETVNIVNGIIADNRSYIVTMKDADSGYTGNRVSVNA